MNEHYILALDDDPYILDFISDMCRTAKTTCIPSSTAHEAEKVLIEHGSELCTLGIIDLFLDGDRGDFISQKFIEDHLIPRNVPYCRFTSAPDLVPSHLIGLGIFDKRKILSNPDVLYTFILSNM